jgi:hypothetical protein
MTWAIPRVGVKDHLMLFPEAEEKRIQLKTEKYDLLHEKSSVSAVDVFLLSSVWCS